jgi:hypothetical protein
VARYLTHEIDYKKLNNKNSPAKLEILEKFINFLEAKLNKTIEEFDLVKNVEPMQTSEMQISMHHLNAVNFLQSTLTLFGIYFMHADQPSNAELIRIIPQVNLLTFYEEYILFIGSTKL